MINCANKTTFLKLLRLTNVSSFHDLISKKRGLELDKDHFVNVLSLTKIDIVKMRKNQSTELNTNEHIYIKYARVSTKTQLDNNSITAQLNSMSTYLQNKNINELNQYKLTEYSSAWSKIPSILNIIITNLKNVTICFAEYDRFNRQVSQFLQKIKPLLIINNIKLLFVSDGKTYHFNTYNAELHCLELMAKLIPCQLNSELKSINMKKIKKRNDRNKRKTAKSSKNNKVKICVKIKHN